MARVTVEDCVLLIPNRFELVMMAAHRAREIASGAQLQVDRDRDKNPVVSLREIADQKLNFEELRESLVKGYQRRLDNDASDEELKELIAEEQKWATAAAAMAEGMAKVDADMAIEDAEAAEEADLDGDEDEDEDGLDADDSDLDLSENAFADNAPDADKL